MKHREAIKADIQFFTLLTIGWLVWLWVGMLLTLSAFFLTPLLTLALLAITAGFLLILFKTKLFSTISKFFLVILCLSAVIGLGLAFSGDPSIFSGRDQGSYSTSAIRLAQNGELPFATEASQAFFEIYGAGKALNFPGFHYTEHGQLITQFPLGYISWLGSTFALLGLHGFSVANAITTFFFLAGFYSLLTLFVPRVYALCGYAIAAISLPVVWISKITLSENLALALFVLLSLHLVLSFRTSSNAHPLLALAIATFFAFTRIEGVAFLILTGGIVYVSPWGASVRASGDYLRPRFVLPILLFIALCLRLFFLNIAFYTTIAKAFLRSWQSLLAPCTTSTCLDAGTQTPLWSILQVYGLMPVCIIGCIGIMIILKRNDKQALIPLALALPTFFYFIQPSISADHPWMLRRFLFSLYPALLFTAIVSIVVIQQFFDQTKKSHSFFFRKPFFALFLLMVLFLSQVPTALSLAPFSDNKNLFAQTQVFAQQFSDQDLVLIDRLSTGDTWSMLPAPLNLLGIDNAVYFFNPEDLRTLDVSSFHNVFLVTPLEEAERYLEASDKQFELTGTFDFQTQSLSTETSAIFPQKTQRSVTVLVFRIH